MDAWTWECGVPQVECIISEYSHRSPRASIFLELASLELNFFISNETNFGNLFWPPPPVLFTNSGLSAFFLP